MILRAVALLVLSGPVTALTCDLHFDSGVTLKSVPVATTAEEMARGLSGVDSAGQGMLFDWPESAPRAVWMRDTRVPLSVGFLSGDGLLFRILDMQPMTDDYHYSLLPAQAALELAQGDFERIGLSVGSTLVRRSCDESNRL